MRFGGHETFPVREGWLHKGLKLINNDQEAFSDPYVADALGVGRNMAKSIRHWLIATGLAETQPSQKGKKGKIMVPTELGKLIWKHDPYFLQIGTWIALHINLVNNPEEAQSWQWFFSRYSTQRFDRISCSEALKRHVDASSQRSPALRTLQRDVACLLSTYAVPVPNEHADPEDASDSPFRRLGLLTYFRDSHLYRRNEIDVATIPAEMLGYALCVSNALKEGDLPLREACFVEGGLGRCLQLGLDAFIDVVEKAEAELPEGAVRVIGSAGERNLRVAERTHVEWLEAYYHRTQAQVAAA
ncbi:hypothetical protein GCM10007160_38950 [Litchfieldella qijiaojingensis]|uniref:DUF4007 domain-containing protein n=1 Tax=Litchfieldella qijiaojingensis TaxID=980347 RepID=A0ABQ2ZC10_9GAMM|nr:DUF4007 family protein [Halomonas qijiaojingensis]GGY07765.1 hypothetical protein GCM10007160_38950 [Halomonas qijiaojingensis]